MGAPCLSLTVFGAVYFALAVASVRSGSKTIHKAVSENVTFQLSSSSSTFKDLMWTKDKHKVVDWDGLSEPRAFSRFEGRIHLDTKSGALSIFNLSLSDEGVYEFFHTKENFHLSVFEPLPSPEINYTRSNGSIRVKCWIPEYYKSHLDTIIYSWKCSEQNCTDSSTSEIQFNETEPHPQQIRCIVKNPLFNNISSSITLTTKNTVYNPHIHVIGEILIALFVVLSPFIIFIIFRRRKQRPGDCEAGGNTDEAVGSLLEPKPDCNGTEGNMDQSSTLLQDEKPACDTVEGNMDQSSTLLQDEKPACDTVEEESKLEH